MAGTVEVTFIDEQGANAALKAVRDDSDPTDWVAYTYAKGGKNNPLELLGSGSDGLGGLKNVLSDEIIVYALLRVADVVDGHTTVKFVHIIWIGGEAPMMQRARMGTHKGAINRFIGAFHVDIQATHTHELTEELIMDKVTTASGTASHVLNSAGKRSITSTSSGTSAARSSVGGGVLSIENNGELQQYIAEVRNEKSSTDWLLFSYGSGNSLVHVASGSGGINDLVSHLQDDSVMYGLLRVTDKIDMSVTVKFVFILWLGERVPTVRKAVIATHKGAITNLFGQYHVQLEASHASELTEDIIKSKVGAASGSASHVLSVTVRGEGKVYSTTATTTYKGGSTQQQSFVPTSTSPSTKPKATVASRPPSIPASSSKATGPSFNEDEVRSALLDVRSDSTSTDWALLGYDSSFSNVVLKGTGSNGIEELKEHLADDQANYGLLRVNDHIDGHQVVRFVLITWAGERLPIMKKARLTTHKGTLTSFIGQFHCELSVTHLGELSQEIVMKNVQFASGSAVHVRVN